MITTDSGYDLDRVISRLRAYKVGDAVSRATCREAYVLESTAGEMLYQVALLDLGAKDNIARSLRKRGCRVTVYPAGTKAEEILGNHPDELCFPTAPEIRRNVWDL